MISSRRLAREWALKILYQMDVGGATLAEARDSSLERLRNEFVQRGSRSASGSQVELLCLEYVTSALNGALDAFSRPLETQVTLHVEGVFSCVPGWQESFFEKSFKYKFKGYKLVPSRLLAADWDSSMDMSNDRKPDAKLNEAQVCLLSEFTTGLAVELPAILAPHMRREAREAVSRLTSQVPLVVSLWDSSVEQKLFEERIRFNARAAERWRRVAQIVLKETTDWMRVGSFVVLLVNLWDQRRKEIDRLLLDLASGWKLNRQAAVDRNILRLAALEMLYIPDIPTSASINEAVELAKKFSTAESSRFVNGVLGAVAAQFGDKKSNFDFIEAPADEMIEEV